MIDRWTSWTEASSLKNVIAKEMNTFSKDWISRPGVQNVASIERWNFFRAHSENANSEWSAADIMQAVNDEWSAADINSVYEIVLFQPLTVRLSISFRRFYFRRQNSNEHIRQHSGYSQRYWKVKNSKPFLSQSTIYASKDISKTTHVWLKQEVRATLQNLYKGSYNAIQMSDDKEDLRDWWRWRRKRVSVDRLKPVYTSSISFVMFETVSL